MDLVKFRKNFDSKPASALQTAQLNFAELERPKQRTLGRKLKTIFDHIRFIEKYFVYVINVENKMNILKWFKRIILSRYNNLS